MNLKVPTLRFPIFFIKKMRYPQGKCSLRNTAPKTHVKEKNHKLLINILIVINAPLGFFIPFFIDSLFN